MGNQIVCTRRAISKSEFSSPKIEFDGEGKLWTYIVANRLSDSSVHGRVETAGDVREIGATSMSVPRRYSMIAHYTDHAANERTFLAWIRTGLAVVAFGFFLFKLNVLVDAVSGGNLSHISAEDAGGLVAVAARYAGLALVVTGSVIVARSSADFERRRRAIEREEVIQIPHSRAESLLSAALVIPVVIFCIYLALL
jgi:inner membrane protein YidH